MKKRSSGDKVIVRRKTKPTKSSKERTMNIIKYIGMDVHVATTVIAIRNSNGKVLTEAIVETKTSTIKDFFRGQRGTLHETLKRAVRQIGSTI